jgi:hypothetical protein
MFASAIAAACRSSSTSPGWPPWCRPRRSRSPGCTTCSSPTTASELCSQGLTPVELAALELLTRKTVESYELYILRIAYARGAAGRLARVVKLADLDDHIARPWVVGDPPYAWARRHIAVGCARAA